MWDRLSSRALLAEQSRLLAEWVTSEVRPFASFWGDRLAGTAVRTPADLDALDAVTEIEVAGAGGPGNPALLILPTEDGFKRHASRRELLAAARELGATVADGRRAVLFRRYKPVHVHEAGVARLVAVAYSRSDLDRLHLAGARLTEVLGLGADDAMVNVVPSGPSLRFWGLYHAALAARMTALHPRAGAHDAFRATVRGLALLPATVLAVPVDEAAGLLAELLTNDVRAQRLRTLLTVGPPPPVALREQLLALAGELAGGDADVRVQAVWAPEAGRALWGECRPRSADPAEATYGLHTYPDMEIVSVRDVADGRGAVEGDAGELLVTSLGWRGTALLRFATGTWVGGLTTQTSCPACGRSVPRVAPEVVEAAWQPRIVTADNRRVRVDLRPAPAVLSPAELGRAGARRWSLSAAGERLVLTVDGGDPDRLEQLARVVGGAVGVVPHVAVDPAAAGAGLQLAATPAV